MTRRKTPSPTLFRTPNAEQAEIKAPWLAHEALMLVNAGAGTGKTSLLEMCSHDTLLRKGRYITFSAAMAKEAKARFPDNTKCRTAHGWAWASGMRDLYVDRIWGKRPRLRSAQVGERLGMKELVLLGNDDRRRLISVSGLGECVLIALKRFCQSDCRDFEPWMIKPPEACDNDESKMALREHAMPFVRKAWRDIVDKEGILPFNHDCYLKIWALGDPKMPVDFVMFDEAQDASPAMVGIIKGQTHAQRMIVGDRYQSIYRWRGAVNAMTDFPSAATFMLRQSYRFGPEIAEEANKWLAQLRSSLRLRGLPTIPSRLDPLHHGADAVLCRSNLGALKEIIDLVYNHQLRVAFVAGEGRIEELKAFALAAAQLQANGLTSHPELCCFTSWRDLKDYVANEEAGHDLKTFVDLVDTYGTSRIVEILDSLDKEKDAQVIVSTAHGAKGREWATVRVSDDFVKPIVRPSEEEAMLAYVTVTRAKLILDRGSLSYIDEIKGTEEV